MNENDLDYTVILKTVHSGCVSVFICSFGANASIVNQIKEYRMPKSFTTSFVGCHQLIKYTCCILSTTDYIFKSNYSINFIRFVGFHPKTRNLQSADCAEPKNNGRCGNFCF